MRCAKPELENSLMQVIKVMVEMPHANGETA